MFILEKKAALPNAMLLIRYQNLIQCPCSYKWYPAHISVETGVLTPGFCFVTLKRIFGFKKAASSCRGLTSQAD